MCVCFSSRLFFRVVLLYFVLFSIIFLSFFFSSLFSFISSYFFSGMLLYFALFSIIFLFSFLLFSPLFLLIFSLHFPLSIRICSPRGVLFTAELCRLFFLFFFDGSLFASLFVTVIPLVAAVPASHIDETRC